MSTIINFESYGDKEALPIVFLHGMPTDRRSMIPRFEPVFESCRPPRAFRRVYPDLPGAGTTPKPASITKLDEYIDAIVSFIDAETASHDRVALVGSSWGALFAIAYATRRMSRVAGLALIAPHLGPQSILPALFTPPANETDPDAFDGLPEPLVAGLRNVLAIHKRPVVDAIVRDVVPGMRSVDMSVMKPVLTWTDSATRAVSTLQYDGPTLILTGRQDSMCGYLDAWHLAMRLPRSTYVLLDPCGHAIQTERIDLVRAHTSDWLTRLTTTTTER